MDTTEIVKCRQQLERDEGRKASLYRDSLGYLTIGIGRLLDPRKGGRLRESEIDFLFRNDCQEAEEDLRRELPWFGKLNGPRQAALVNMRFQLGLDGLLGFTKTLRAIGDEKWEDARHQMLTSLWAKQTPERARRVAQQIATGEWQ